MAAPDRLKLLTRLTEATPDWVLTKGAAAALDGRGDVDCAAPAAELGSVWDAVSAWAAETGRGPVLTCDHLEGTVVLAVVEPGPVTTLVQIDLLDHRLRRGVIVLRATDLLRSTIVDPAGFRSASAGAEAVARLLLDEWRPGGAAPGAAAITALSGLLQQDPAGAAAVTAGLDPRLQAAVEKLSTGTWPRRELQGAELGYLARCLRRPDQLADRIRAAPARRSCPLLAALANERTVEGDLGEFLTAFGRHHPNARL
ncbi:MAG: hypothetical protein H0X39_18060 [Actinobacteria bacterium]|nr:hypothetical protein [Actinomycetota bacterium]